MTTWAEITGTCHREACTAPRDGDDWFCSPLCRLIHHATSGGHAARSHPVTAQAVVRDAFDWLDTRADQ